MRPRGWALALLVSCARSTPAPLPTTHAAPPPPPPPSFSCRGREATTYPEPEPPPTVASGRLVVQRLPLPPAAVTPSEDDVAPLFPFGGVRLRVVSEAVPLSRFATALAEALRIDVSVPPEASGYQVTIASPDLTAAQLLEELRALGVASTLDADGVMRLQSLARLTHDALERSRVEHTEATETVVFPPIPGVPFDQLARLLCDEAASPQGRVDVVAGHLLVRDVAHRMRDHRRLVDFVTTPAFVPSTPTAAPPGGFSCFGPPRPPFVPRVRLAPVASGRLAVQRLPLPSAAPRPRAAADELSEYEEDTRPPPTFAGVRLRVLAEAAPLAAFAVALSEQLHITVLVEPHAHDLQVTFSSSDIAADRLLDALHAIGVESDAHGATLFLSAVGLIPDGLLLRVRRPGHYCPEVPETRVLPSTPGVPLEQVARYFCETLATDRGTAHVVAGRLFVHDVSGALNQVEQLVRAVTPAERDTPDGGVRRDGGTGRATSRR